MADVSNKAFSSVDPAALAILAVGAHPDDLEFSIGGLVAREMRGGKCTAHFLVCSKGECASRGTPEVRMAEAAAGAKILGASLEFLDFAAAGAAGGAGDAHLQACPAHAMALAAVIRKLRPAVVLAPAPGENQHPDHAALSKICRDALRLARYGGIPELRASAAHAVDALLFYAVTPEAEPRDIHPVLFDISDPAILDLWTRSMQAHASQLATRNYLELQLARARLWGLQIGPPVTHAVAVWPADPLVLDSLSVLKKTARHF